MERFEEGGAKPSLQERGGLRAKIGDAFEAAWTRLTRVRVAPGAEPEPGAGAEQPVRVPGEPRGVRLLRERAGGEVREQLVRQPQRAFAGREQPHAGGPDARPAMHHQADGERARRKRPVQRIRGARGLAARLRREHLQQEAAQGLPGTIGFPSGSSINL